MVPHGGDCIAKEWRWHCQRFAKDELLGSRIGGEGMSNGAPAFAVEDWWAWAAGRETRKSWQDWAIGREDTAAGESDNTLPAALRRRITPVGQRLLQAGTICAESEPEPVYVFASRHGEMTRTLSILTSLTCQNEVSPADFSLAVHNALAGLLSIHFRNTLGHTALASGPDTFAYGFMEALACVHEEPGRPVLYCYGDAPLPGPYADFSHTDKGLPLVVALMLRSPLPGEPHLTFSAGLGAPETQAGTSAAEIFLRFLLDGGNAARAEGERMNWHWARSQ